MKQPVQLQFKPGKKFNILCFGDLHERLMLTTRENELKFRDMHLFMEVTLKAFQPDLVVFLGDTLCEQDSSEGFSVYKEALKRIIQPVSDMGIPFGYVLGNHEHDTKQEQLIIGAYDEIPGCMVYNDAPEITGELNCNLVIKSSDGERDAFNLWFMDSNNRPEDDSISTYDWVHDDQIEWYEKRAEELKIKNGATVPAVLFQHIPVPEEYDLLREAKFYERPVSVISDNDKRKGRYVAKVKLDGYLGEGPCSPDFNNGQFESWKKTGDVKGAFFGHDHMNDFTGEVDGILLGQNKTSGFNAYTDGCRSCVRLITLDENDTEHIKTKVYHFKEFGLESRSLGPIFKRITDRQSINLHEGAKVLGITAAAVGLPAVAATVIKKIKQK